MRPCKLRRLWILHHNPYSDHWSCFYPAFLESFEGTSHSDTPAIRSLGIFHSSHQFIKLMCYQKNRSCIFWSKALLIQQAFASSSRLPLSILIKFSLPNSNLNDAHALPNHSAATVSPGVSASRAAPTTAHTSQLVPVARRQTRR